MPWPTRETWEFINTFAPWLSALGTLAAVAVSFHLALRDRARLRLYVNEAMLVSLHLSGRQRGWGFPDAKNPAILQLLWWDPRHRVCSSLKKRT